MKMKFQPALILIILLSLLTGVAHASTITLNPCDQNSINAAIDSLYKAGGGTVYLNAGIYPVTGNVVIKSNIILTGDPNAIIRVSGSSSQWFTGQVGVISNPDEAIHNVEIYGFQIDGNIKNLPRNFDSTPGHDRDCEKIILFGGFSSDMGSNISIHDMTIYDSFSDGIYIRFTDGVYIYNNINSDCQHEGFYLACCRGGHIYNNQIAGICSDGGRLDNCQYFLIEYNLFYSYSGPSYGAYKHGENSLQIGNQGGSSHGYTPTQKPFTTENIEVTNNTFVSPGLQAFSLSGGENVYIHDNIYKDADELTTSGFRVGNYSYNNYSYTNPPTLEQSKATFEYITSIFDIVNFDFITSFLSTNKRIYVNNSLYDASTAPKNLTAIFEQHPLGNFSYTLVYLPTDGLSMVRYKMHDTMTDHILLFGEVQSNSIIYTNVDTWSGDLPHEGNVLHLSGIVNPDDIKITCYAPVSSFVPGANVSIVATTACTFSPWVIIFIVPIFAFLGITFLVFWLVLLKR